jgi:DNA repair exonuclease SbcCD nuclease subunit
MEVAFMAAEYIHAMKNLKTFAYFLVCMLFAHFADCHVGGWREPKLREVNTQAFERAVDMIIESKVDFLVIAGDLFNTAVPDLESLKRAVTKLRLLKDSEIPVYVVPGSHDYSASGKTIIDVLEGAGMFTNVVQATENDEKIILQYTRDEKTGALLTGLPGRKGTLEKAYFNALGKTEEKEGFKIFVLHTTLTEYRPKELERADSTPISLLPKGFDYYAAGHVHYVFQKNEPDYGIIAYPGPLFPNNFRELEQLGKGGFYLVEDGKPTWQPVQLKAVHSIELDCENMTAEQVEVELLDKVKGKEFVETIVTMRLTGTLKSGKPSDIDFRKIYDLLYKRSAYFVMKNTNKLQQKEFQEVKVEASVDEIEEKLIGEHLGNLPGHTEEQERSIAHRMMSILAQERAEGEKVADFEKRLIAELKGLGP